MRKVILVVMMGAVLMAGKSGMVIPNVKQFSDLTDFQVLKAAKEAFDKGDFASAAAKYAEVANKNDQARYNYANSLYKLQKYDEALTQFDKIPEHSPLKPEALYNGGNAHAFAGDLEAAQKAYEAAKSMAKERMELLDDIEHNLEVIKKLREAQQQQQQQQNDPSQDQPKQEDQPPSQDQKNQSEQQQNGKEGQQDQQENDTPQDKRKQEAGDKSQDHQGQNTGQNSSESGEQSDDQRESPEQGGGQHSSDAREAPAPSEGEAPEETDEREGQAAAQAEPISDMQERKYQQLLKQNSKQHGVNTLMVPLSKGEHRETTTPW